MLHLFTQTDLSLEEYKLMADMASSGEISIECRLVLYPFS